MADTTITLSAPPRPVTPRGRRRSWAEKPVRGWLVVAVVVGGVMAYLAYVRVAAAWEQQALIDRGTAVTARITKIGLNQARTSRRDERLMVELTYAVPGGGPMVVAGELPPRVNTVINVNDELPIKIDPKRPQRWTDPSAPQALSQQLAAVYVLSPLLALSVAMVLLQRGRVMRVWRDGVRTSARVVSVKQIPLAPRSRAVGVVIDETQRADASEHREPASGAEGNAGSSQANDTARGQTSGQTSGEETEAVMTCWWPDAAGRPAIDDVIDVVHLRGTDRVLCAAAWE